MLVSCQDDDVNDTRPPLRIEPLRTDRLDLTPLDPVGDAPDLHAMLSDPAVHRYDTDARASASLAETETRLGHQVMANGGMSWAVRLRAAAAHPQQAAATQSPAVGTIGVFADQGTAIRGVGWSLASSYWRQGIMSEAARAVVPFLLAQDGVDKLEAWVDSCNVASIGVARAAGMRERARLPRVYDARVAQTVVMACAARPVDPEVFGVTPTLVVADLAETVRLLTSVLALQVAWEVPGPPTLSFLAVESWSGSPGLRVVQGSPAEAAAEMLFEVGISVDRVRDRVEALGLFVVAEPTDEAWGRREMSFRLPDGTQIRVSGPSSPPSPQR